MPKPEVTPGHKVLRHDTGTWRAVSKFWMAGPDKAPLISKGRERTRMIGGLWSVSDYEGEFAGERFVGHGITGYDKDKNEYHLTWVDSLSDRAMTMRGRWDAEKKELTFVGEAPGPNGTMQKTKSVTRYVGQRQKVLTMYMATPDGGWMRTMEITYTREPEGK